MVQVDYFRALYFIEAALLQISKIYKSAVSVHFNLATHSYYAVIIPILLVWSQYKAFYPHLLQIVMILVDGHRYTIRPQIAIRRVHNFHDSSTAKTFIKVLNSIKSEKLKREKRVGLNILLTVSSDISLQG